MNFIEVISLLLAISLYIPNIMIVKQLRLVIRKMVKSIREIIHLFLVVLMIARKEKF